MGISGEEICAQLKRPLLLLSVVYLLDNESSVDMTTFKGVKALAFLPRLPYFCKESFEQNLQGLGIVDLTTLLHM